MADGFCDGSSKARACAIYKIYHNRLKTEDNCLKCGWCTAGFKRCFPCIMRDKDDESRQRHWRKLVHHPKFRAGADARWQDIQIHVLAEVTMCMSDQRVLKVYSFSGVEDFKRFLLLTRSDQAFVDIFTTEKAKSEIAREEWPCVGFYCMTILGALLTPLDPNRVSQYDYNFFRETNGIANRLCKTDAILRKILKYLEGSHDIVEQVRASSVITCFAGCSREVTQQIAEIANFDILVNLFTAGWFAKQVGARRDKPYPRYARVLIALGCTDISDDVDPASLSDDDLFSRCRHRAYHVLENSGQLLYNIASLSPAWAAKVFEWPGFLPAWIKWLRQPLLIRLVDQAITGSAAHLLQAFVHSKVLARCLVEEKNLLTLLERLLYMPHDWPLELYLSVVKILLSHGNQFIERVVQHDKLVFAVGCYAHSQVSALQDHAMPVIAQLYKTKPHVIKYLHAKGIITQSLMFSYMDPLARDDDVNVWSTLIIQRAKRTLGRRWSNDMHHLARPHIHEFEWERMKEEGNRHFQEQDFEQALRYYRSGVICAPRGKTVALLHSNSAECYLRLQLHLEAVREATLAVGAAFCSSPLYVKTLFRRAKAFHHLQRPFEALADISVCLWKKPDDAKFKELRANILKDYKKIPDTVYKVHACAECGWEGEGHKKCAQCLVTYFCSPVCQRRAWPLHKLSCGRGLDKTGSSSADVKASPNIGKRPPAEPIIPTGPLSLGIRPTLPDTSASKDKPSAGASGDHHSNRGDPLNDCSNHFTQNMSTQTQPDVSKSYSFLPDVIISDDEASPQPKNKNGGAKDKKAKQRRPKPGRKRAQDI